MSHPPSGPGPQGPNYGQQPGPYQGQPGQYPPSYGQPPQKKSKKKWYIGCGLLLLLGILALFAGCAALLAGAENVTETPATVSTAPATTGSEESSAVQTEDVSGAGTVTFEATASTNGTVIWGDLDGSTNTEDFTGSWTKEVQLQDDSEIYNVTVTGDFMDDTSEVTCKLYVDGELVDEASGTGSAGSASCSQPIFG